MKDLNPFIKELLFANDCVILPHFGGFIGNYTPARIDRDNHTFHPPVKSISFNSRLSHNDGLLIGKVSEKKGIGYADARQLVENYVNDLRDRLKRGERVHLDDIGHFQLNGEGSIQFEPDNNINYLLDSYGLSSFTRQPVEGYDISRVITRDHERDPMLIASRRRMIWRAAAVVPFVLALVLVPLKTDLFRSQAGLNPLTKVEFEEIRSAQDALFSEMPSNREAATPEATGTEEEEIQAEESSGRLTVEEATATKEVTGEEVTMQEATPAVADDTYHLVVGSFGDVDNARRLFDEIVAQGYDAELVKAENGYYRVSAKSFTTLPEARDELAGLKGLFPGIWIWKED